MHCHVMVEHYSEISHTLHGRNAVITNLDDIDWHVHLHIRSRLNIRSRERYHFCLVVIEFQVIACHPHIDVPDTCLHSINLVGWIVLDIKRNVQLHIICI